MKKSKRGMALAGTLILMTIVLMMSTLMMTLTLYSSQLVAANEKEIDQQVVLDDIGNRFLDYKNDYRGFLAYYVENNADVKYYAPDTSVSDDPTDVIKGTVDGIKLVMTVKDTGNTRTLTVSSLSKSRQLLKVTCSLKTDVKTGDVYATLKSWNYGGING